jgi:hypothetical protein
MLHIQQRVKRTTEAIHRAESGTGAIKPRRLDFEFRRNSLEVSPSPSSNLAYDNVRCRSQGRQGMKELSLMGSEIIQKAA